MAPEPVATRVAPSAADMEALVIDRYSGLAVGKPAGYVVGRKMSLA